MKTVDYKEPSHLNVNFKIGDLVGYKNILNINNCQWLKNGIIMDVCGKKWVKVTWPDKVIVKEHVYDLEIMNEDRRSSPS